MKGRHIRSGNFVKNGCKKWNNLLQLLKLPAKSVRVNSMKMVDKGWVLPSGESLYQTRILYQYSRILKELKWNQLNTLKNFDQLNNHNLHNLLKTDTKTVTVYPSIIVPFPSTRDCNRIKIGISRKFIDWQKPFNSPWLRRILLKWRLLLKDFVNDGFSEWRFEIWEEDVGLQFVKDV